ncbi:MAG: hypothetical protein ACRYG7_07760 [Janthinobacterium lividum]
MKNINGQQLGVFDNTIDLVANNPSPNATSTDRRLIHHLGITTAFDENHWSVPRLDRRRGVHSLFQYPGRMVPEVQQTLVHAVKDVKPSTRTVLDPYMGSATSLVASMYSGLECYGQDINPLAILIGRVKTTFFDFAALTDSVQRVYWRATQDLSEEIEVDFKGRNKWFREDVAIRLSRLRRAIMLEESLSHRRVLWLVLAETIRLTSNDRTSTYKLHARPIDVSESRIINVCTVFQEHGIRTMNDLITFRDDLERNGQIANNVYRARVVVDFVNSTEKILETADKQKFDLLVTSPPYGDNRTTIPYGEHAYLPLQWINLEDIDPKVAAVRDWLLTTNGIDRNSMGGIFAQRDPELIEELREASPTLREHLAALASAESVLRRKVIAFYDDFYRSLKLIATDLKPDAYLIWTLGNRRVNKMEIRNDAILQEFMGSLGCDYVTKLERIIHSKRMPHKNSSGKTMANEQILILRKNGG